MNFLAAGQTYQLTVGRVVQEPETYQQGGVQWYAHIYVLTDEEKNEYPVQICDQDKSTVYANTGDFIEVKVTTVPKIATGKYTVKFSRLIMISAKKEVNLPVNPVMHGTAAAIALQVANEYFKVNPETTDDNLYSRADKNFNWLKSKIS